MGVHAGLGPADTALQAAHRVLCLHGKSCLMQVTVSDALLNFMTLHTLEHGV